MSQKKNDRGKRLVIGRSGDLVIRKTKNLFTAKGARERNKRKIPQTYERHEENWRSLYGLRDDELFESILPHEYGDTKNLGIT